MTTCYVFGAGASIHARYPLASTMGGELMNFMLEYPLENYREAAQFVIDTFGKSPNIEDVITELEARIQLLGKSTIAEDKSLRTRLGNCRGLLVASIREWFRVIHTNPAPAYAEFADRVVQPGDVVITFNYDDSLERELRRTRKWDVSRGYGFPLGIYEQPSEVLFLKLHGSTNWLVSMFDGLVSGFGYVGPNLSMGQQPVIHAADLEFLGYTDFSGHTYKSGGAFPSLILPGREKEFFYETSFGYEFTEFWDSLWSQASEAVQRSDQLVICGYSLLPVDQRACDLLLREPKKQTRVTVISGSQSDRIANDFRGEGFQNVEVFKPGYFEDWVKATHSRRNVASR